MTKNSEFNISADKIRVSFKAGSGGLSLLVVALVLGYFALPTVLKSVCLMTDDCKSEIGDGDPSQPDPTIYLPIDPNNFP